MNREAADQLMQKMRRQSKPPIRLNNSTNSNSAGPPRSMLQVLRAIEQRQDPALVCNSAKAQARHFQDRVGLSDDPLAQYLELRGAVPLWDYQRQGVDFMHKREREGGGWLLCDEMGMGKTKQALTLVLEHNQQLAQQTRQRFDGPTLVICSKLLIQHWLDEVAKFPRGTFVVLDLSEQETLLHTEDYYYSQCDLVLVTYQQVSDAYQYGEELSGGSDSLRLRYKVLYGRVWKRVMADEAHEIVVRTTLVSRALLALQSSHRCAITGTPLQNRLQDLRTLIDFSGHTQPVRDSDIQALLSQVMLQRTKHQLTLKEVPESLAGLLRAPQRLEKLVSLATVQEQVLYYAYAKYALQCRQSKKKGHATPLLIHWMRQLCLAPRRVKDLAVPRGLILLQKPVQPPPVVVKRFMEGLPLAARYHYTQGSESCSVEWNAYEGAEQWLQDEESPEAKHYHLLAEELEMHGTVTMRMCESPLPESVTRAMLQQLWQHRVLNLDAASSKERAMLDYIKEAPREDKLVVVSMYIGVLKSLQRLLQECGELSSLITGQQSDQVNGEERRRFRQETRVLLMSLKKGGQGLNLEEANHLLTGDEWWNPSWGAQADARIQRPGQRKQVHLVHFVTRHTLENYVLQVQQSKQRLVAQLLPSDKPDTTTLSSEEEARLFDYRVTIEL